jgi:hypothetical protein
MTTVEEQIRLAFIARTHDLPDEVTAAPTLHALTAGAATRKRRTIGFAAAAVAALAAIGGSLSTLTISGSPVPVTAMSPAPRSSDPVSPIPSATILVASIPRQSRPEPARSVPPSARPARRPTQQPPPVSVASPDRSVTGADHVGSSRV